MSSSGRALDLSLRRDATVIEPNSAASMINLTIMIPVLRWAGAVAGAEFLQEPCKRTMQHVRNTRGGSLSDPDMAT